MIETVPFLHIISGQLGREDDAVVLEDIMENACHLFVNRIQSKILRATSKMPLLL
jgi:hypothetical protein